MSKVVLNNLDNLQNETTAVATINANNDSIEAAINQAVFRNGGSPNEMDADFDMNSHRILNLPAPIYANDVVRLQDTSTLITGLIPSHSITNPKLAQGPAFTVKGNNTSATADETDITVSQLQSMTNQGLILAGVKLGVNMNTTADQPITITMPDHYSIFRIFAANPSVSLTTAVGGLYTAAGKTGVQIVANSQVYSGLTTSSLNVSGNLVALALNATIRQNTTTVYFSLTTPQGAPATADIYIYAFPLYSVNLNPSNPTSLPTRIRLAATTNFYITPTGNDANNGAIATPWLTLQHAYNYIQSNYDLSGQNVIVNVADGTYLGITGNGPIVGQASALALQFRGNVSNPGNCIIADPNSYAFGAAFSCKYAITGFKIDMTNGRQDMITSTSGSEIWIVNPNPGTPANVFIFGTGCGLGFNDMSAAYGGKVFIDTWVKYTIDDSAQVNTTGTWISGSGQMVVASATGLKIGMAISGTGLYANTNIVNIVGTTITLNGVGSFASGTNVPLTFVMGRQCHADVGVAGQIIHNTNGTPGYNAIDIIGSPFYYGGFLLANGSGAQCSFQTITFTGNCRGPKFVCKTLGSIDTASGLNPPATYLPGDSVTKIASFAADTKDITISPTNGNIPYSGTEVFAGSLVCSPMFRSPGDSNFQSATAEMTTVEFLKGSYSLGTNSDLRLTRPSIAAGSSASITFVGCIGTGGIYN